MLISANSWKPENGSPVWAGTRDNHSSLFGICLRRACVLCGYQTPPSRSYARKVKKVISQGPRQGLFSHSAFPLRWRQKRCGLALKLRKQPWGSSWAWVQPPRLRPAGCERTGRGQCVLGTRGYCLLFSTLLSCCSSTALTDIHFLRFGGCQLQEHTPVGEEVRADQQTKNPPPLVLFCPSPSTSCT